MPKPSRYLFAAPGAIVCVALLSAAHSLKWHAAIVHCVMVSLSAPLISSRMLHALNLSGCCCRSWNIKWSFVDCGGKRKNTRKVLDVETSEVFEGVLSYNKQFQITSHAAEQQ